MSNYEDDLAAITEKDVTEYEKKNGTLPAHNKNVLRDMVRKENDYWMREAVREDSNNTRHD